MVDDDALSRELLVLLLAQAGYAAEAVESGAAAIAALRADSSFDLLLVDLQMPGIAGSVLARELRRTGAEETLLAMSASQPAKSALEGFDGFLLKPFSMETLAAAIEKKNVTAHQATKDEGVLNEEVYCKLTGSMSAEKLAQLYALCLGDVKRRVEAMRQAAAEGDDAEYRRQAHAIKGGCGLVGATELQTIAAKEENRGITANHVVSLDEILLACTRLEDMLVANNKAMREQGPVRSHA